MSTAVGVPEVPVVIMALIRRLLHHRVTSSCSGGTMALLLLLILLLLLLLLLLLPLLLLLLLLLLLTPCSTSAAMQLTELVTSSLPRSHHSHSNLGLVFGMGAQRARLSPCMRHSEVGGKAQQGGWTP